MKSILSLALSVLSTPVIRMEPRFEGSEQRWRYRTSACAPISGGGKRERARRRAQIAAGNIRHANGLEAA